MRDFSTPRTYILSGYRFPPGKHSNAVNHADLSVDLANQGVPFLACEGSFAGHYEQGFIVTGAGNAFKVSTLATLYRQDSFLTITEHDRTAYLVDTATGYHSHLGKFESVGPDQPEGDWTLLDGTFYTVRATPGVDLPEGL
jgi:hypothetical protein